MAVAHNEAHRGREIILMLKPHKGIHSTSEEWDKNVKDYLYLYLPSKAPFALN